MLKPTSSSILLLLAVLFVVFACNKFETEDDPGNFVKYFGGSKIDSACDMVAISDGYVITGQISANTGIPQAAFIRTDLLGNELIYSPVLIGQGKVSLGRRICKTADGDFLIVGSILESASKYDILLRKINSDGVLVWSKNLGTLEDDEGFCVTELTSGEILVGGYTRSIAGKKKDAWVIKLSSIGEIIWSNTFGGINDDICFDLLERDSYFLLTGSTESFQYNSLKKSVFLVQIDKSSGNGFAAVWYGGSGDEAGVKSKADDSGNIYILANNTLENASGIFLLKFKDDNFYEPQWEKYINSDRLESGNDMLITTDHIIITGSANSIYDADFLVYQLDHSGNVLNSSSNTLPAMGNQSGQTGALASDGQIVIAGTNSVESFSRIALVKTSIPK